MTNAQPPGGLDELIDYWFLRFHDKAVGNRSDSFMAIKQEAKTAITALLEAERLRAQLELLNQIEGSEGVQLNRGVIGLLREFRKRISKKAQAGGGGNS